jgi:Sec-independent protein translocase protein TatA
MGNTNLPEIIVILALFIIILAVWKMPDLGVMFGNMIEKFEIRNKYKSSSTNREDSEGSNEAKDRKS